MLTYVPTMLHLLARSVILELIARAESLRHAPLAEFEGLVRHMEEIPSIPEHHSPVRHMLSQSHGETYQPLISFQDAQSVDDAVVILEGDWGGQIYLVCPMRLIHCQEVDLRRLLRELDKIAWACNEGDGAGIYYERRSPGEGIAGGMGGGVVTSDLWVHNEFKELGLETKIRAVLGAATGKPNG